MDSGEQYVSWKALLLAAITVTGIISGIFFTILNIHASQPHTSGVSLREFQRLENSISRLEKKIDDLQDKISSKNRQR